jgi:hypothetical protein
MRIGVARYRTSGISAPGRNRVPGFTVIRFRNSVQELRLCVTFRNYACNRVTDQASFCRALAVSFSRAPQAPAVKANRCPCYRRDESRWNTAGFKTTWSDLQGKPAGSGCRRFPTHDLADTLNAYRARHEAARPVSVHRSSVGFAGSPASGAGRRSCGRPSDTLLFEIFLPPTMLRGTGPE